MKACSSKRASRPFFLSYLSRLGVTATPIILPEELLGLNSNIYMYTLIVRHLYQHPRIILLIAASKFAHLFSSPFAHPASRIYSIPIMDVRLHSSKQFISSEDLCLKWMSLLVSQIHVMLCIHSQCCTSRCQEVNSVSLIYKHPPQSASILHTVHSNHHCCA